jgi:flagellar basal-body rod protein FlgB
MTLMGRRTPSADVSLMGILDGIFSGGIDNIGLAMHKATQRQNLLMGNLANINTPGYQRKDVDFNLTLGEAMGRPDAGQQPPSLADNPAVSDGENNVNLEQEVEGINETQLRYAALSQLATNYFGDLKSVINQSK